MTDQDKWQVLLDEYNCRRKRRIMPSAVPQVTLRNKGVSATDIEDWKKRGLVLVLRSINDNIIKPTQS